MYLRVRETLPLVLGKNNDYFKKKSDYGVVKKNQNEVEEDSQNEKKKKVSQSCEYISHDV